MPANDTSVVLEKADLDYAKSLVEQGVYASLGEAVRGELARARDLRVEQDQVLVDEVLRRARTPKDQWIWADSETYFTDRFRRKHGLVGNDS